MRVQVFVSWVGDGGLIVFRICLIQQYYELPQPLVWNLCIYNCNSTRVVYCALHFNINNINSKYRLLLLRRRTNISVPCISLTIKDLFI
jgi:hypothetical protein